MLNILVVDDSVIIRKNLGTLLKELGHNVVGEAANGYDAIQMYKLKKPQLVTMDITMPGVQGVANGIEALKQIRQFDKDAQIIMITSHGEEELVLDAIEAGAKGYILKPINKEKISNILKKF